MSVTKEEKQNACKIAPMVLSIALGAVLDLPEGSDIKDVEEALVRQLMNAISESVVQLGMDGAAEQVVAIMKHRPDIGAQLNDRIGALAAKQAQESKEN